MRLKDGIHGYWQRQELAFSQDSSPWKYEFLNPAHSRLLKYLVSRDGSKDELSESFAISIGLSSEDSQIVKDAVEFLLDKGLIEDDRPTYPIRIWGERERFWPRSISLELNEQCNLHCSHCYRDAGTETRNFLKAQILDEILGLSGIVRMIELTGGEPTLHPNFSSFVDTLSPHFELRLLSNATLLARIPTKTLTSFSIVSLSMYGYDEQSFYSITGSRGFSNFEDGVRLLTSLGISIQLTIVANRIVLDSAEQYVQKMADMGIAKFALGALSEVGRAARDPSSLWLLSVEDRKRLVYKFNKACITIPGAPPAPEINSSFYYNIDHEDSFRMACQAGLDSIVVSPQGNIRPCQLFPVEFYNTNYPLSFSAWKERVSSGLPFSFIHSDELASFMKYREGSLGSICSQGFVSITNTKGGENNEQERDN